MKALALLFTLAFITSPLLAAEDAWITDVPKAMEQAKSQKKLVLLDFTGSDWCPPCKNLHKTVLKIIRPAAPRATQHDRP